MWYETFHVFSFDSLMASAYRIFSGTFDALWTDGRSDFGRMLMVLILFFIILALLYYLLGRKKNKK